MPDQTSEQFTDEQLAEWRRVTEIARDSVNDLSDVIKGQYLDWSLAAGSPAGVLKLLDQLEAARARVAELEAAQATPDAYIAVKRYHSPNADGAPEWWDRARVFPAGEEWAVERAEYAADEDGCEWLPIVADGDGTRFAATLPAEPDGYSVTVDAIEGGRWTLTGPVLTRAEALMQARFYADKGARAVEQREVSGE